MVQEISDRLQDLVDRQDGDAIKQLFDDLTSSEVARAISLMPVQKQDQLLGILEPNEAANVVDSLSDAQAAQIIGRLVPETAAGIVHELPSNEQADLLGDLLPRQADSILAELGAPEASQLRQLTQYPDDVAGGLMITEMLVYSAQSSIGDVLDDLRKNAERYRDFQVQYAFVVDQKKQLVGVLRLRDLLLARADQTVDSLMIKNPLSVNDEASLDELRELFEEHHFLGVPVVDSSQQLLGLVTRDAVEEAIGQRADEDYLKTQGIVKEELRSMPTLTRSRRRLAWLSVNIGLNVMAASVIAAYEETVAQVIALSVFLPIISDMSGCSGNQAIAVSMRELSLGLARPGDVFRVWLKEIAVGILIGLALGLLIALVAFLWKGNAYLGLVVGVALFVNTLVSVSMGGTLPLIMKRYRMDPALASGPILTTVTDICGFFILLSLATAMMPLIKGG